ncbi:MAG: orotidine-5'-phosphate decarboxylase [Ignavibacteriaceae bacterium]|nr:orotidine-5'-phosphate decarboxylase [Ignavibacteriaceae bacterium]
MTAQEKISLSIENHKHICVGLDTDIKKIPSYLHKCSDPIFEFNSAIIEATKEHAGAYKINLAFYERYGISGLESLMKTVEAIPNDILVIGDGKRNDIGNTAEQYAISLFDQFSFDCATVNPYMGEDSVMPFLKYEDKISFILALTSNPGAKDFEKLELKNGELLYQHVLKYVNKWNKNGNCGIVFGATQISELETSIGSLDTLYTLIPGVGAQGGDLDAVVRTFTGAQNNNFLINMSRNLIYADNSEDFALTASEVITGLNQQILAHFAG